MTTHQPIASHQLTSQPTALGKHLIEGHQIYTNIAVRCGRRPTRRHPALIGPRIRGVREPYRVGSVTGRPVRSDS